jgi:hypothetical protein
MKSFKIVSAIVLALSLTACASSSRVEKLETQVQATQIAAQQASAAARLAHDAANTAQKCCVANGEKMDRMFKQSMNK